MTKSSGLVAFVVVAFTLPFTLALTDLVKSLAPSFFGPTPVQPVPLQAPC